MIRTALVTLCLATPMFLEADIQRDGRALRPLQRELRDRGVRVTLDVDRAIAVTGDHVVATLTAYSRVPSDVALELRVLDARLDPGSRVAPEADAIDDEQIVVHATPAGERRDVEIALGDRETTPGRLDRFQIFVARADRDVGNWDRAARHNRVAAVDVLGWSGNRVPMAITADEPYVTGQPLHITVRMTNTTDASLPTPLVVCTDGIAEVEAMSAVRNTPVGIVEPGKDDSRPEQDPARATRCGELDSAIEGSAAAGSGDELPPGDTYVEHDLVIPKRSQPELAFSVYAQFQTGEGAALDAYDVVAFPAGNAGSTSAGSGSAAAGSASAAAGLASATGDGAP